MATRNIAATIKVWANLLIANKLFSVLQTLTEMLTTINSLYFTSGHISKVIYHMELWHQRSYCSLKYITGIRDEMCMPEGFQRITSTRTVNTSVHWTNAIGLISQISCTTFQSFLRLVHMRHPRTGKPCQLSNAKAAHPAIAFLHKKPTRCYCHAGEIELKSNPQRTPFMCLQ